MSWAKVLPTVTSSTSVKQWEHDDGQGDPWWSGGSNQNHIDGKSP